MHQTPYLNRLLNMNTIEQQKQEFSARVMGNIANIGLLKGNQIHPYMAGEGISPYVIPCCVGILTQTQ